VSSSLSVCAKKTIFGEIMTYLGHICLSFYLYPGGVFLSGKEHPSFLAMTAPCINLQELKELKGVIARLGRA
jgi:hypothetical protein